MDLVQKSLKVIIRVYFPGTVLFNFEINSSLNVSLISFQINSQATYKLNQIKSQTFFEKFMDETQEGVNPMPWTIHQQ